jgi:hypothetical protein
MRIATASLIHRGNRQNNDLSKLPEHKKSDTPGRCGGEFEPAGLGPVFGEARRALSEGGAYGQPGAVRSPEFDRRPENRPQPGQSWRSQDRVN